MTSEQFNNKYKKFIEEGYDDRGMEIDIPEIVEFFDRIFEDVTKIPGFHFSMVKQKWNYICFYSNLGITLRGAIEIRAKEIIENIKK